MSPNRNDIGNSLREAWNVSTKGYMLILENGNVAFGNEQTKTIFDGCVSSSDVLGRLSSVTSGSFFSKHYWRENAEIRSISGEISSIDLEFIPVIDGSWVVLRTVEKSAKATLDLGCVSAVLDHSDVIVTVADKEGRIVRFNRAAEALSGYTEQQVLGRRLWDLFIPEGELISVQKDFEALVEGNTPIHREVRCRMRDGSLRDIAWSNALLRDSDNKIGFVVSSGIDVTATRQAESALASLAQKALDQMQGERSTLSRFLHDTVSQDLVALSFSISTLQDKSSAPGTLEAVDHSMVLVDRCCRDIRQLSYILSPPLFNEIGLVPALQWYGEELQRVAGLQVELDFDAFEDGPTPEMQAILFAMLQACVVRSIRQNDKRKKRVELKRNGTMLSLRYECQLQAEKQTSDFAELIEEFSVIRERLRQFHGTLYVESRPGTIGIVASLPYMAAK